MHIPGKNKGLSPDGAQVMLSQTDQPTPDKVIAKHSDPTKSQPSADEALLT